MLMQEGLLERGGRGVVVTQLSRRDVDEIASLRSALELLVRILKRVVQVSKFDRESRPEKISPRSPSFCLIPQRYSLLSAGRDLI